MKDRNDLWKKFLEAQERDYETALREIKNGRKYSHWIWYIFPQIVGLGHSSTSKYYALQNLEEAKIYLQNDTLRNRLIEITEALYSQDGDIYEIMGRLDGRKVLSSMTLFREADPGITIFQKIIDKFFGGSPDNYTLKIISGEFFGEKPSRETMAQVFRDTMEMISESRVLNDATAESRANTELYREDDELNIPDNPGFDVQINVSKHRSFEAAKELRHKYPDEGIAVLNFASAVNPGGGVVTGARAQEESLCRCSTLYPCLNQGFLLESYYHYHRAAYNPLYSDACIYTPDVYVIKSDTNIPQRVPEEEWYKVNIITCAAPNLRHDIEMLSEQEQYDLHMKRARRILSLAALKKNTILVLGAFGCGAFHNDPRAVAEAYKNILAEMKGYFKVVEFAIFTAADEAKNYSEFYSVFMEQRSTYEK